MARSPITPDRKFVVLAHGSILSRIEASSKPGVIHYGLNEAIDMLFEEGLEQVFARHQRWAVGVRSAVEAWGLEIQCLEPAVHSPVLTGVVMPEGVDADAVRQIIEERFDLSLGAGLGKAKGKMFRIGHLGDSNDLTLVATLAGCEAGMKLADISLKGSGVMAALDYFADHPLNANA